jgi:hypothetical protein
MTATPKAKPSESVQVDADALYDRLEGVSHRESIEAEVDRALSGVRTAMIDNVVARFAHKDELAAKKEAKS